MSCLKISWALRITGMALFIGNIIFALGTRNWHSLAGWSVALIFSLDDIVKRPPVKTENKQSEGQQ